MKCNLCLGNDLQKLEEIGPKRCSVTSDSRLCPAPSIVFRCPACHHLQKHHTAAEKEILDSLYNSYDAHGLSMGIEQLVFPENLPPRPRSFYALEQCMTYLPGKGNLLDVGSGNGAVLKSASKLLPEWNLYAFDIVDKYQKMILGIPNVREFVSSDINDFSVSQFDLIVLWNALEHIEEPRAALLSLRDKLSPNGYLLLQVPDIKRNPFDLAIIDHCSHFTGDTLESLISAAGYEIVIDGLEWFHNCLTLLLKKRDLIPENIVRMKHEPGKDYIDWLNRTLALFETAIQGEEYAIFGTTMAAIFVAGQLSKRPAFFIDEDPAKQGNAVLDVPILLPEALVKPLKILMPFVPSSGKMIMEKMKSSYKTTGKSVFILSPEY